MMVEIVNNTRAQLGTGPVHMSELPQAPACAAVGYGRRL